MVFTNTNNLTTLVLIAVLFSFSRCKKIDKITVPEEQNWPTTTNNFSGVNGTIWININIDASKQIQELASINDQLIYTWISGTSMSSYSLDGSHFYGHTQGLNMFGGISSGVEKILFTDGIWVGVGNMGSYGAAIFDTTNDFSPWQPTAIINTNAYSYARLNGVSYISAGVAPKVRSTANGNWSQVGQDLNGWVSTLKVFNGELVAGGNFSSSGSTALNNIAKWDGVSWVPLGAGLNGPISDMVVYENKLIVCGKFGQSGNGNTDCSNIAVWDGTTWTGLGTGLTGGSNGGIVMYVNESELIIGGDFNKGGSVVSPNIIKWNGSNYVGINGGLEDPIGAITVFKGSLYVANQFYISNGNFLKRLN